MLHLKGGIKPNKVTYHLYTDICIQIYVCMSVYIHMYVYRHAYIHAYIHTMVMTF